MRAFSPLAIVLLACSSSHGSGDAGAAGSASLGGSANPQDPCIAVAEPCTDEHGTTSNKFSQADAQRWQTEPGAHDVIVLLKQSTPVSCSQTQRQAFHEVSQACVKRLIQTSSGSVVEGSTSWFINMFEARLNWEQVQRVAAHPQVQSIENSDSRTPPPGATPRD
jgi:hypothetical protein